MFRIHYLSCTNEQQLTSLIQIQIPANSFARMNRNRATRTTQTRHKAPQNSLLPDQDIPPLEAQLPISVANVGNIFGAKDSKNKAKKGQENHLSESQSA